MLTLSDLQKHFDRPNPLIPWTTWMRADDAPVRHNRMERLERSREAIPLLLDRKHHVLPRPATKRNAMAACYLHPAGLPEQWRRQSRPGESWWRMLLGASESVTDLDP